jgi:pimeloyl-ACP methyl ester carboxylesterase
MDYPQSVGRLAVLNSVFNRTPDALAAVKARAAAIAGGDIDLEAPTKRWFRDTPGDKALSDKVRGWLSEVDITAYAQAYQAFAHGDDTYAARWPKVRCPVLALTADGDPNSTPEMSRAIADAAGEGQALVIEGHRHMVSLTDPAGVNAAMGEWLGRPACISGERT